MYSFVVTSSRLARSIRALSTSGGHMRALKEVLEELMRHTGVSDPEQLPGATLPGLGEILGVTWDEEEGAILWYTNPQGSTRAFHWEAFFRS